jgi:zinc transporter ZupT
LDWNSLSPPILGVLVAVASAATGVVLTGHGSLTRYLIPLSGGILILVAAGVLLPELAVGMGWPLAIVLAAAGYGALTAVDRLVVSVCPSCDHVHDHMDHHADHASHHDSPVVRLEGFAVPLLAAVAIHAFVDGWGLVVVQGATPWAWRSVAAAIVLHKIPEGLTLGAMTRASFTNAGSALAWCALAEFATVAGGCAGLWLTPVAWVSYPLAIAAGTFLFLGGGALGVRLPGRG